MSFTVLLAHTQSIVYAIWIRWFLVLEIKKIYLVMILILKNQRSRVQNYKERDCYTQQNSQLTLWNYDMHTWTRKRFNGKDYTLNGKDYRPRKSPHHTLLFQTIVKSYTLSSLFIYLFVVFCGFIIFDSRLEIQNIMSPLLNMKHYIQWKLTIQILFWKTLPIYLLFLNYFPSISYTSNAILSKNSCNIWSHSPILPFSNLPNVHCT